MGALSLLLRHPGDLVPLLTVKRMADNAKKLPKEPNLAFCYDMLNKVSRSFAIVIQQLPHELQDAVCIFYLVLRALDTVEDDMSIPDDIKCPELEAFHEKIYDPEYTYPCGEKHYKRLMDEYPKVTAVFLSLKKEYQDVIADITKRMGEGMSNFIKREVVTLKDWDEYCHYVAGLVGIGLSDLWASSLLEDKRFAEMEDLSNSMGLFLQKTNIIRDYLEDIVEEPAPRMFWPKCVWSKYGKTLDAFQHPENRDSAVSCMNHLITIALSHGVDSLEYMSMLKNVDVFRFCAIPQVMAIATLAECYDNGKVFEGVVKIRRGLSARIMLNCLDIFDVAVMFKQYTQVIKSKVRSEDPSAKPPCGTSRKSTAAATRSSPPTCTASATSTTRTRPSSSAPSCGSSPRCTSRTPSNSTACARRLVWRPPPRGSSCLITRRSSAATVAVVATTIFLLTGHFF